MDVTWMEIPRQAPRVCKKSGHHSRKPWKNRGTGCYKKGRSRVQGQGLISLLFQTEQGRGLGAEGDGWQGAERDDRVHPGAGDIEADRVGDANRCVGVQDRLA